MLIHGFDDGKEVETIPSFAKNSLGRTRSSSSSFSACDFFPEMGVGRTIRKITCETYVAGKLRQHGDLSPQSIHGKMIS